MTDYIEYDNAGTLVHARGDVEYNKRDQVLLEKTRTKQGSDWIYTHTVNYYSEAGQAVSTPLISSATQAGTSTGTILAFTETKHWKNGSSNPVYGTPGNYSQADLDYADAYVTNSYSWTDSAVQYSVNYNNRDGNTTAVYNYDHNGSLTYVDQTGGTRPRDITFTSDAQGRVLERTENDNNYSQSDPRQRHYRFGGIDMGTIGNNGSDNIDYDASIIARTAAVPTSPGAFRGGATTGTPFADFDMAYDAVNGTSEAPVASYYTVRSGDTLATIAQTVWGDASLWYMLAEVNGLSGTSATATLTEGTGLIVPEKGANFHNSADTFRPYDPQAAIGDTQPGAPKPQKKNNCGVFGQILMVAIAVAVTIVLTPVVGPVAAAGIGSAVSQLYGMAIGIQNKFSFKQVAISMATAAISPAVGQAIGPVGGQVTTQIVHAAATSAVVQGVSVATGLQKKFSWTAVAAAGVGAGLGTVAGRGLAAAGAGKFGTAVGSITADAMGQAATRSLIDGTDFGDNLIASLPSAIGSLVRMYAGGSGMVMSGSISGSAAGTAMGGTPSGTHGGQQEAAQSAQSAGAAVYDGEEIVVTGYRPSAYQPLNIPFRENTATELINSPFTPYGQKKRLLAMMDVATSPLQQKYRQMHGLADPRTAMDDPMESSSATAGTVVDGNGFFAEGRATGSVVEGLISAVREKRLADYVRTLASKENYVDTGGFFHSDFAVEHYGSSLAGASYSDLRSIKQVWKRWPAATCLKLNLPARSRKSIAN